MEELHGLFTRQPTNCPTPGRPPGQALVATTQRPTFMKCASRATMELDSEFQPHQVYLLRPFSHVSCEVPGGGVLC